MRSGCGTLTLSPEVALPPCPVSHGDIHPCSGPSLHIPAMSLSDPVPGSSQAGIDQGWIIPARFQLGVFCNSLMSPLISAQILPGSLG